MSRSLDREEVFKGVFSSIALGGKKDFTEINQSSKKFVINYLASILSLQEEINGLLSNKLYNWDLDRIGLIERAILMVAVYEIKWCEDIDDKVAINEAIELAKKYGDEAAPSFVNGVLATIVN